MRVLHVFDHSIPLHSGYTFRSRAILREQRKLGWETAHVTGPKHAAELARQGKELTLEEEVEGLRFYRAPLPTGWRARAPVLSQMAMIDALSRRLMEVIRSVKPDVLHAHSPALNGAAALRAAKKFNLPLVYEVRAFWEDAAVDHGTCREGDARYRASRALETYVLRRADAVTCICEGLRNEIAGRGISADKITVIPNAVDIEKFALGGAPDQALQASLGLAGAKVLGFIGSFYAYEGLDLLLDAFPKIFSQIPNARVLLVGGGPQEASLKQQAQRLGIADKIVFTGRVPHGEVNRYYDLIDLLIYPRHSMRLTELVTPLKPLEAMAQGRLFVASDVGGHHELVRHGETGWLFKADDVDALTEGVLAMFGNEARWPAMREAGRRYVQDERNWQNSVARYERIYGHLSRGSRAA